MENELLKDTRKHFSKLGLMYFLGTLLIYAVQYIAILIFNLTSTGNTLNFDLQFLATMLPMYAISMPLMGFLIKTVPAHPMEKHKMTVGQWFLAFMMCYALMYLSNIIGLILTQVIGLISGTPVNNAILSVIDNLSPFTAILVTVILAPVAEELLFRKLLIDRTCRYGEGISILLSGLMFGLFHGNLNQFAYAFTLGVFFGFIYVKTGNIKYTILMHMVINFMSSVVAVFLLRNMGYTDLMTSMSDPTAMTAIVLEHLPAFLLFMLYALVLFVVVITGFVLLLVNLKKFHCNPGEISVPKGKRFATYIFNIGMILFILYWVIQIIIQLFQ